MKKLCYYGCGQDAKFKLKNGKIICTKSPNSCPVIKNKNSVTKIGDKNPMKKLKTRIKLSKTRKLLFKEGKLKPLNYWKGKKHTQEYKDKMSKKLSGKNNPNYGGKCYRAKRYRYKNICFRSTWEAQVAQWLDNNNYTWEYEPKRFYFDTCSYLPDFYVKELNLFIEVKGRYTDKCIQKIELFKKNYSNLKFLIIDKNNLKEYK